VKIFLQRTVLLFIGKGREKEHESKRECEAHVSFEWEGIIIIVN
jgi:hypothetical protein